MKEKVTAAGSVLAAVLASSCCWGPLLMAGLGAGGAGFASALAPYRPYFIGLTFLFLAGAWYLVLRTHLAATSAPPTEPNAARSSCRAQEAQESCCAPNGARRRNIPLLSGVTAFALAVLASPQIGTVLAGSRGAAPTMHRAAGPVASTTLVLKGMTCEACAVRIREALLKVPGVVAVAVSARTASSKVTFQRGKVSTEHLKQAVAQAGYRVTSVAMSAARLSMTAPVAIPVETKLRVTGMT
jgi:copper chaperone CopZ